MVLCKYKYFVVLRAVALEKLVADQQKLLEAMEAKQVELEQLIGSTKVELESAGERNKVLAAHLDQLQVKCGESERAQVQVAEDLGRALAHQVLGTVVRVLLLVQMYAWVGFRSQNQSGTEGVIITEAAFCTKITDCINTLTSF
jgi:hypothetical protein